MEPERKDFVVVEVNFGSESLDELLAKEENSRARNNMKTLAMDGVVVRKVDVEGDHEPGYRVISHD